MRSWIKHITCTHWLWVDDILYFQEYQPAFCFFGASDGKTKAAGYNCKAKGWKNMFDLFINLLYVAVCFATLHHISFIPSVPSSCLSMCIENIEFFSPFSPDVVLVTQSSSPKPLSLPRLILCIELRPTLEDGLSQIFIHIYLCLTQTSPEKKGG